MNRNTILYVFALLALLVALLSACASEEVDTTAGMEGKIVPAGHTLVAAEFVDEPGNPHWVSQGVTFSSSGESGWTYGQSAVMLTDVSTEKYFMWITDPQGNYYVDLDRYVKAQ